MDNLQLLYRYRAHATVRQMRYMRSWEIVKANRMSPNVWYTQSKEFYRHVRILDPIPNGYGLFVTSEPAEGPRRYTLRVVDDNGCIWRVSEKNAYAKNAEAKSVALELIEKRFSVLADL